MRLLNVWDVKYPALSCQKSHAKRQRAQKEIQNYERIIILCARHYLSRLGEMAPHS